MAFQDERRALSWSLTLLLSLAMAGCGMDSDSSHTTSGDSRTSPTDQGSTGTHTPSGETQTAANMKRPVLHWNSPLTRIDGSKLYPGEISGYRIYYRLRHQETFQSLVIEGPDVQSLSLDDFDVGAYEFAISTLDTEGLESRRSDPVAVDLI